MSSFVYYLKGYVRIRISGDGGTRFVNICSKRDIRLWNVEKKDDIYCVNIMIKDFRNIKDIVHKTGVKASILSKHGLPFLFARMSARKCFIIGAFLCFFWLVYMKNFIWAIEINGNVSITDEVILDYLQNNQINMGTKIKEIDMDELEKAFRRDFDDITWISVSQEGTALIIEIKERDVALYEEESDLPCSLYAPCDGVISSIVVRNGLAQVKEGDSVVKGQLLVDGILPVVKTDGTVTEYRLVSADADIVLCYTQEYYDEVPFVAEEKSYTGEVAKAFYLRLGETAYDFHMFLPEYERAEISQNYVQVELWEYFYLPVWYGKKEYKEYKLYRVERDKNVLEDILYENLAFFLESLEEKGVQNIQKDVKISTSGSMLTLSGGLLMTTSNMHKEEINASIGIGTESENGQYNSVIHGNER